MTDGNADTRGTGAFGVNEQFATAVRFDAHLVDQTVQRLSLKFINGRHVIARTTLNEKDTRALLGEENFASIQRAVRAKSADATPSHNAQTVRGVLKGSALHFREAVLPDYTPALEENAIHFAERTKATHRDPQSPHHDAHAQVPPVIQEHESSSLNDTPSADPNKPRSRVAHQAVPSEVNKRFLRVDNQYYFPDHTLAFVDRGSTLKAKSNNLEVIRSLITIAQARDWDALKVTGSNEFRRTVWVEASLRGIEVQGYTPTELERAHLERRLEKGSTQKGESRGDPEGIAERKEVPSADHGARDVDEPPKAEDDLERKNDTPREDPEAQSKTSDTRVRRTVGQLLAFGAAPYRFDTSASPSYYVKLETEAGERTLWGVDLERAMKEAAPIEIGDQIRITHIGAKPVSIKSPVLGPEGRVIGEETVERHRNAWMVEKLPTLSHAKRDHTPTLRGEELERLFDERSRTHDVTTHAPAQVVNALATMRAATLAAEQLFEREKDRERFVTKMREHLREALRNGEPIRAPRVNAQALPPKRDPTIAAQALATMKTQLQTRTAELSAARAAEVSQVRT